jgi:hypothetical protein
MKSDSVAEEESLGSRLEKLAIEDQGFVNEAKTPEPAKAPFPNANDATQPPEIGPNRRKQPQSHSSSPRFGMR